MLFLLPLSCYSANIVFVSQNPHPPRSLELAANFYGVNLKVARADQPELGRILGDKSTLAVVMSADSIALFEPQVVLRQLKHGSGENVPLLIAGVTPEIPATVLEEWSGGHVTACKHLQPSSERVYRIRYLEGVTEQLSGFHVPLLAQDSVYFELGSQSDLHTLVTLTNREQSYPSFVQTRLGGVTVFLDCTATSSAAASTEWNGQDMTRAFPAIASAMMFVRFSAAEHGWHSVHHYANLTIDDPWLRVRYGFLDYKRLLEEMERHRFHTTIAFIPWNYDRSQAQVVSLIQAHPDRFSISIHGDNHDHKEFTDYRSKPLKNQVEDLRQSLARMDRFQALTGIPYDKVMIFPHSIAPEKTLAALKNDNYLATVNSSNVPMDMARPPGLSFELRAMTLAFAGFLSLRRYSVEGPVSEAYIALNVFLGNPLLFYCHQGFFASGIGAFDGEADYVNRLDPGIRWRGLGEIVKHLYFVKLRDDGDYDLLSFSNKITIENVSTRKAIFYVRKREIDRPAMVSVDGESWPYLLQNDVLEARIPLAGGQTKTFSIAYSDTAYPQPVSIEKSSFRVYFLRTASDFRDIGLSRFVWGRSVIRLYKENEQSVMPLALLVFAVGLSVTLGIWRLKLAMRGRSAG